MMDDDPGGDNISEEDNAVQFLNIEWTKSLKSKIQRLSFEIIENTGQGDCLFHSLQEFIEDHKKDFNEIPNDIEELRLRIVNYILSTNAPGFISNWDRFVDNIIFNNHKQIPSLLNIGKNKAKIDDIKKDYFNYMTKSGHYGTFTELTVAAEIHGFAGSVIQIMENGKYNCFDFGLSNKEEINIKKPILFLLFSGPSDKGHFRYLRPRNKTKLDVIPSCVYDLLPTTESNVSTISNVQKLLPKKGNIKPFVCEICEKEKKIIKRFETLKGLRIHCSKIHGVSNITINSEEEHGNKKVEESEIFRIAKYKSTNHLLKRIPKGARILAANKYASVLEECVSKNDFYSWENLLLFSYKTLFNPNRKEDSSLVSAVKKNILAFTIPTEKKKNHTRGKNTKKKKS